MKKALKIIKNILIIALTAVLVVTLFVVAFSRIKGEAPSLFGLRLYVITTGSMEPEIKVGDIVIGKNFTPGDTLNIGDVITFVGQSGEMQGKFVTHKIIDISGEGNSRTVTTQGVANNVADAPFSEQHIQSIVVHKTVVLPFVYKVITNPVGFVALVILPLVAMIVSEVVSIVKQVKQGSTDDGQEGGNKQ